MPSSESPARLQIVTAASVLTEGVQLHVPVLITQIASASMMRTLHAALQAAFSLDYPVSIVGELAADDPQLSQTTLEQIGDKKGISYPAVIYLPAQVSAVTIAVQQLVEVVAKLRSPDGGCPWDLEQTPQSLTPYIIEEAYETIDAIQSGRAEAMTEELGDLLLQVVLQAQIASEQDLFSLEEIAQGITKKLIRRHPHVFADVEANSVEEVRANWEDIKAAEKGEATGKTQALSAKMQRYTRSLPPLMAGLKLSEKAAAAGLEWQDLNDVWTKFYEELAEFQESLLQSDTEHQLSELGDLFFTLVNVARWCQLDPTAALRSTNKKLIDRISTIEAQTTKPLAEHTFEELEALWQAAKQQLELEAAVPAPTPVKDEAEVLREGLPTAFVAPEGRLSTSDPTNSELPSP
ncbi:nucleoside triphosphate pyrophosphohydrolase [Acaryochloris sp. IP29b_bin.137]|uniref:nucleoside triphosphate pyrophosphohydrolase n=1 Tax=Acaryochloris sp. IP29b_bin.137 TaxID=2969217 RepID=UPI002630730C|nr:nucleoside triphosphate pyrophosphohydrolase [Acaryochloris sp. IP29b_bin.137]